MMRPAVFGNNSRLGMVSRVGKLDASIKSLVHNYSVQDQDRSKRIVPKLACFLSQVDRSVQESMVIL